MDVVSVSQFHKAFPRAKSLENRDLRDLLGGMRRVAVTEGQQLFADGDPPGPAYLILRGLVRVERKVDQGRTVLLGRLGRGDFVGDMSLIEGAPRIATALMEEEGELLRLEPELFARLRAEAHPAALWLLSEIDHNVALRIREMYDRLSRVRDVPSLAAEPAAVQVDERPWYQRLRDRLVGA
ncbi:MAG: cyclic nucleotide-binding domain-containing protein [Alphaproteobacteria bacterium]|nr:cyclic nucleotide-binding domain-containing protein [Alphaproteobacteria bacterium]